MHNTRSTVLATIGLLVAAFVLVPQALTAKKWTTGPVDQVGFQALVDAASPGDTIACLGGEYHFGRQGPVVLDKGLRIVAATANDPPLFVGDIVEGTVDDPVLGTDLMTGNTAFRLALGAAIHDLQFRGLHFTGFERTLVANSGHAWDESGCPPIPGAEVTGLRIEGNQFRQTRRAIQIWSGPLDGFVVNANTIDPIPGGIAILVVGDAGFCESDGSIIELIRPKNGVIKDNLMRGGNSAVIVAGAENVTVKSNTIEYSALYGILVSDSKGLHFPDDGPIPVGEVKDNHIIGTIYGIIGEGPTTMEDVEIKGNLVVDAGLGILLDVGANGFEIKGNIFSDIAIAEVYLGYQESGDPAGAWPPDTHDNSVEAAAGDRVFDFGVNNTVVIED